MLLALLAIRILMNKEIIIKRPKQQRSKAKFDAILAACPKVLSEFGFKKATTANIALEADVGIGTVYDYFSNKEAIIIAYIDNKLTDALATVASKAKDSDRPAKQVLEALLIEGVRFAVQERLVIQAIFLNMSAYLSQIDLHESRDKIFEIAANFAENQEVRADIQNFDLLMYSLTNIMLGFQFRLSVLNDESFEQEEIVSELMAIIGPMVLREST